jgi:FixJ family two-component response regulator
VVDDDAAICRALKRLLETLGYIVMVFHSAESLLATEIPSEGACLLVDIYMPGMSGVELCGQLDARGAKLPRILMSAHDDERTRQAIRKAKPVASLFKPFDERALLHALRKAARKPSESRQ